MSAAARNRVPHIVFLYWVIKIAATTLGETGADMFSMTLDLGYATTIGIFLALFAVLLAIKLALERYAPVAYWLTFTASAIAGTAISDFIDRTLGLGYGVGSVVLVGLLLVVLGAWYAVEGSLSVERITTNASESFYWTAFLIANTLGTAAGDYLADDLEVGFLWSAALVGALLGAITLLHYRTRASKIALFWLAFVLTRPFGATFGDLLTKPLAQGGLDLGTVGASLCFSVILVLALYKEVQIEAARAAEPTLPPGVGG